MMGKLDNRKNEKIEEEIERLKKENEELKQNLRKTIKEKKRIEREYARYRMRHPETVGVKNGKPYHFKKRVRSLFPKKPGARKGHKPHFRKMPEQVDETAMVAVGSCPCCGGGNLSGVQEYRTRVVEDIPICNVVVTKHKIERRYCRDCKKLVESPVLNALPNTRIGLRTMLLVAYLKIGLRMPVESIKQQLEQVFGMKISEGEICHILEQLAEAFGQYYDQIIEDIKNAAARNLDETTWRINGENKWLWAFITKTEALYKITNRRNHKVPLEVLGKDAKGVDIHDRHSVYKALAKKTKRLQQDCWSHIICNAKELAQFYGKEGQRIHRILKHTYKKALAFDHKGTDEDIEELFRNMKAELIQKPYKSHKCWKFVENLLKEKDNLFQFVKNPDVEGTNNRAERGLRHSVIARKISGGNKTQKGAHVYERLTSIHHTLKLRNQNLLQHGPVILQASHG